MRSILNCICHSHPPGKFQLHQRAMRRHLICCFERGHFTVFSVHRSRRNENRVKSTKTTSVFCSRRMPELSGIEMIQCSCCREWFHINFCVNVDKKVRASKVPWHCITCNYMYSCCYSTGPFSLHIHCHVYFCIILPALYVSL